MENDRQGPASTPADGWSRSGTLDGQGCARSHGGATRTDVDHSQGSWYWRSAGWRAAGYDAPRDRWFELVRVKPARVTTQGEGVLRVLHQVRAAVFALDYSAPFLPVAACKRAEVWSVVGS